MNTILQWEPDKSRFGGSARIENVLRIRDDLMHLADRIKAKADATTLTSKADSGKVADLENAISQIRVLLDDFKKTTEDSGANLERRVTALADWVKSNGIETQLQSVCDNQLKSLDTLGSQYHESMERILSSAGEAQTAIAESLATCRALEKSFSDAEGSCRQHLKERLDQNVEQVELTCQNAAQSRSSAELCETQRLACERLVQTINRRADELVHTWEATHGMLAQLASASEEQAGQAGNHARSAAQAASDCRATAQHAEERHQTFEVESKAATDRLAQLLQQAEVQATAVQQSTHLSVAAADLATGLKGDCESLTHALRLKADELGMTWEGVSQTLSSLSLGTQQQAAKANAAVALVERALAEAQAHIQTCQELRSSLQADQSLIGQRLAGLEVMLEQARSNAAATAEHLQVCEQSRKELSDALNQGKAAQQTLAEQLEQSKRSRAETEAIRKEMQDHNALVELNQRTLGRRLRWLLFGLPPSPSV